MPRRAVFAVALVLVSAAGCASPAPRATVQRSSPSPQLQLAPPPTSTTPTYADPTQPPQGPVPVAIPADDYAPEPVHEIGMIEIPAIGLRHRIFDGVTLHNIDQGPSHWTGSAMPGEMGNTIFAGHRTTNDQPFRHIDALTTGDKVFFTVGGTRWTYQVVGHLIVNPSDTWIADQTTAYTGTLYACHPLGSAAQRYVVRLELVA